MTKTRSPKSERRAFSAVIEVWRKKAIAQGKSDDDTLTTYGALCRVLVRMMLVETEILVLSKGSKFVPEITPVGVAEELRRLAMCIEDYYKNDDVEPIPVDIVEEFAPLCSEFMNEYVRFVEREVVGIMNDMFARAKVSSMV